MANPISEDLIREFYGIAEKGDEEKLKKFFLENLKRFPQEARDSIIMAFFEDTLGKKVKEEKALSDFREQGLKTMGVLEKAEKEVQKQEKLNKIKKS